MANLSTDQPNCSWISNVFAMETNITERFFFHCYSLNEKKRWVNIFNVFFILNPMSIGLAFQSFKVFEFRMGINNAWTECIFLFMFVCNRIDKKDRVNKKLWQKRCIEQINESIDWLIAPNGLPRWTAITLSHFPETNFLIPIDRSLYILCLCCIFKLNCLFHSFIFWYKLNTLNAAYRMHINKNMNHEEAPVCAHHSFVW